MTIDLFIILLTAGASVSMALTEAIKKVLQEKNITPAANLIALINAALVGGIGMPCVYIVLDIPFTLENIIAILAMIISVGIGSMVGYDKIIQLIKQLTGKAE